jgi:uncharacterized protein YndB with AHSA1/START domain
MKIVVAILAVLVGLVALVFICGMLIPANHVASRSIHLDHSRDEVWLTVSDFEHYASWAPQVTGTRRLPDDNGHPVWQLEGKWAMPMALDEVETPRQLVTRIADPKLPFGGTWTWELAPENGGTRVIVTERGVIRSPILRVLSRFVFGYNGTMDAYLNALAKHFGESATPGPPPGNA